MTARQFNAIKMQLEGKISSIVQIREEHIKQLPAVIKKVQARLACLEKTKGTALRKKREQLHRLQNKLAELKEDRANKKVRLCFGSKKLFHAQFYLKENGYASHKEWKADWQRSRNSSFFLIGSKEESCGNQSCQASVQTDGSFAALSIARRGLKFLERVPALLDKLPDGKGGLLALRSPVRKGFEHKKLTWEQISKLLKAGLAARARERRRSSLHQAAA